MGEPKIVDFGGKNAEQLIDTLLERSRETQQAVSIPIAQLEKIFPAGGGVFALLLLELGLYVVLGKCGGDMSITFAEDVNFMKKAIDEGSVQRMDALTEGDVH